MTKADIIERIHTVTGRTKKDSTDIFETVFSIMKDALEAGDDIKVLGFGKFQVREKNGRKGRNPHNGDAVTIEARRVMTFKPSPILKAEINR
jgi:integration host factor subunit alpha